MYYVYINYSKKTGKHYVGHASDVQKHLAYHNAGKVRSTKNGAPWKTLLIECYPTKKEAYKRERKIKSYKGGNAFKKLIGTHMER